MAPHLFLLLFPLVLSNSLHMLVVKKDWAAVLARPIARPLFGAHKTWRGFLVLPLLNALFMAVANLFLPLYSPWQAISLGAALGLAYLLFELPNSFLKRRLGIAPGQHPTRNKLFFLLLDKTDSAFGVCLAYFLLTDIPLLPVAFLFLICSGTHLFFSFLLVSIHLKKSF